MARVAGYCRVRAKQRKSIEVVLHGVDGDLPSPHRMTVLARSSKLPAMNIGVAIRALLADLREHGVHMAQAASYVGMHGAQRILRVGIVIEFRFCPNRLPTDRGVA